MGKRIAGGEEDIGLWKTAGANERRVQRRQSPVVLQQSPVLRKQRREAIRDADPGGHLLPPEDGPHRGLGERLGHCCQDALGSPEGLREVVGDHDAERTFASVFTRPCGHRRQDPISSRSSSRRERRRPVAAR